MGCPKPKANGSETSESAASSEAPIRRMSFEGTSDTLGGMPAGTVSTKLVPAEKRRNRNPIFVAGDTHSCNFLKLLRAHCPSSLSDQLKGEKLMIVPGTADGFRSTDSDGSRL